jgi:hypothetical protein
VLNGCLRSINLSDGKQATNRPRKNSEEITKQNSSAGVVFGVLNNEKVLKSSYGGGLDLIFCDSIYSSSDPVMYKRYLKKKIVDNATTGYTMEISAVEERGEI